MIKYIIVSGPDAAGKSHLIKNYYETLIETSPDITVVTVTEPFCRENFRCTCPEIKKLLEETHVEREHHSQLVYQTSDDRYDNFLTDRALNIKSLQNLYDRYRDDQNKTILIYQDRSYLSTLVYQTLTDKYSEETILKEHKRILEKYPDVKPDLVNILDVPMKVILNRLKNNHNKDNLDEVFIKNAEIICKKYRELKKAIKVNKHKYLLKETTKII